jgi:hypothetical protein
LRGLKNGVPAESPRVPANRPEQADLWVSTDLVLWRPKNPNFIARDCQINDRCYRRLDPEYFAWLKLRMHAVKDAVDAGRISKEAFEEVRARFNAMQEQAVAIFGAKTLLEAVRGLDLDGYRPPLPEEWEPIKTPAVPVQRRAESERLARARTLVDEIRDQALALGWAESLLYACEGYDRHPIRADQRIGEVTRQSIEMIGPLSRETRTRFYNPDVEQPWIQYLDHAATPMTMNLRSDSQ